MLFRSPGVATTRFHGAIEHLMAEWDRFATVHSDDDDGLAEFIEEVSETDDV